MYTCSHCGKEYENRRQFIGHSSSHKRSNPNIVEHVPIKRKAWNKGLSKNTDERLKKSGKTFSDKIKSGEILSKPVILDENSRIKISNSMKKAHLEGRAWNIGKSRWNNEPSYPESFFMKVIENEFEDKDYIREYPFSKYSLDFAWEKKKRCIEIDGEQHQRFEEYSNRDKIKDQLLIDNGWQVLRISWKDLYNNPKEKIQKAKNFIMDL